MISAHNKITTFVGNHYHRRCFSAGAKKRDEFKQLATEREMKMRWENLFLKKNFFLMDINRTKQQQQQRKV